MSGKPLPPPLVRPKSLPVDPSAGRTPPVPVRGWFPMFMVGDEARVAHAVPLKTWPALCGVYKFASKAVWLGNVEAPDEAAAIEKGAAEFKVPANRLMAVRR